MSANDQILIKKYKGKYYLFHVMAESWSKTNPLKLSSAVKVFDSWDQASRHADAWDGTEYGLSTRLIKDGASVKLINDLKS